MGQSGNYGNSKEPTTNGRSDSTLTPDLDLPRIAAACANHVDVKLLTGTLGVDQSALTGESKDAEIMTGTNDVHHVQIVRFDPPVKMDLEKVQSRCRAPMPQQTGLIFSSLCPTERQFAARQ